MASKRERERAIRQAREGRAVCLAELRKIKASGGYITHHVFLRSARIHHKLIVHALHGFWKAPRDPAVPALSAVEG